MINFLNEDCLSQYEKLMLIKGGAFRTVSRFAGQTSSAAKN